MISVYINDTLVEVASEVIYNRNRKEQADSGMFVVANERAIRYEPYSRVLINDEQYLIQADNMIEQRNGLYEHNITLFENIAIAKTIFPVDRSFTRVPALSIREILTIYQRELYDYQGFNFSFDTTDTIYDALMVNKEYAGIDFAVILYDLFRSINAIPRFTYDSGMWVLSYELYTETNDNITLSVERRQSNVNDIDYATSVLNKTRNAVSEDDGYIYWPSKNTYMTPRAKGTMYKTSDLQYELDSDIMAIYEVVASVEANITANATDLASNKIVKQYILDTEVDITNFVKESEEYESLPILKASFPAPTTIISNGKPSYTDYYKENCIRWTKENNVIDSLWWSRNGIIFEDDIPALDNAIHCAIPESVWEQHLSYINDDLAIIDATLDYYDVTVIQVVEDIKIRVKYRPRRDIDFISEKSLASNFNRATILNNQKDTTIEIGRYLQNSNAIVNRIGNEVFNLTQTFDTYAEAWKLGDYYLIGNSRWMIVDITYEHDKNIVICDAEFAVNFSNINRETSITRQPSPYLYTGQGVTSNFIYKEYLMFDKIALTYPDNSFLTDLSKRIAMNIFDYSATYDTPLKHLTYKRIGDNKFIDRQLFTAGSGNVMLLHANFNDNRIAGKAFEKKSGSWYQDPIWYIEEITGELERAELQLSTSHNLLTDTNNYKYYPIVNEASADYTDKIILRFDLDPNDKLAITFQINTMPNDSDIIVGNGFTRYNSLIRELDSVNLAIYSSTTPFTMFDKRPKGIVISGNVILGSDYVEVTDALGDPIEYWCLSYNDEIILAANNSISKVYYGFTAKVAFEEVLDIIYKNVYFSNYGTITVDYTEIEIFNEDATFDNLLSLVVEYAKLELYHANAQFFNEFSFNINYQVNEIKYSNAYFSNELALNLMYSKAEMVYSNAQFNNGLSFGISSYVVTTNVEYDITYYLGGGTNSSSNPATFYYEDLPIWLYEPTRSGYAFDGWYKNASFTGDRITSIQTPVDITLYAKWVAPTKTWVSSTGTYWNAQDPIDRGEETNPSSFPYPSSGTLASNYDVGYALKVNNGDIGNPQYAYWVVVYQ